jgi:alpha-1,6-mannosyltransferase
VKVCDLTQSYAPTGGGVRTYLHAKREELLRMGMEHVLIVPGPRDGVTRAGAATTYHVGSAAIPFAQAYRLLLRADKVLRILARERPDVVEVQCPWLMPWTALRHRGRHGGVTVGTFMTDLSIAYVAEPVRKRLGRRAAIHAQALADGYVRALYGRLDATVAISESSATRLRSLGLDNVAHVPLGVDADRFHPARRDPAVRASLGASADDLLLIYAGRLDREKRPDVIADAVSGLQDDRVRLVLIGEGPLRPALERRGRERGRIITLPFVQDRDRLAALMASADVYVTAMPHETFGLSVLEAQSCGLPVLGVRAGAMVDRVPEGTGILVEPDSPAAFAAVLGATAREEWKRMGSRARALVEAGYSWRRTAERLAILYGDLQGGRRPAGTHLAAWRP